MTGQMARLLVVVSGEVCQFAMMMDHWLEITSDDGEVDTINGDDDNDKYRILDDIRLPAILDDKGRRKAKKNVCWGRVAVHEHGMEMGDNPSVTDGAPVMICWQAHTTRSLTIDLYETLRPSENRRQKETDLRLGVAERAKILLRAGYSMHDIVQTTLLTLQEKRRRLDSIKNRKWDPWNALVEKTTRKIKKAGGKAANPVTVILSPRRHSRRRRRASMDVGGVGGGEGLNRMDTPSNASNVSILGVEETGKLRTNMRPMQRRGSGSDLIGGDYVPPLSPSLHLQTYVEGILVSPIKIRKGATLRHQQQQEGQNFHKSTTMYKSPCRNSCGGKVGSTSVNTNTLFDHDMKDDSATHVTEGTRRSNSSTSRSSIESTHIIDPRDIPVLSSLGY